MKYQAIIFDLDGVICHTDSYHFKAWKQIANKLGVHFDEVKNNCLRGISRMESLEILLQDYNFPLADKEKENFAEEKNIIYCELLEEMTSESLSIETKLLLDYLKKLGLKVAIGSSSKNARFILDKIGLSEYFDVVCDGNDITQSKPNPEVFLKVASSLNLKPKDCLVVEDSEAGVTAAHLGGIDCAAIGDAATRNIAEYNLIKLMDLIEIL